MGLATIVTLVAVFLAVATIAIDLIIIAALLNRVSFTVGTILIGVRSIANQTAPLNEVVRSIDRDVAAIESAFGGLVTSGELTSGSYRSRHQRVLPAGRGN